MTFKQLEQFLKTEKWRAGSEQDSDMCGKYARCAYCDHFCDYPCARAYDTLMQRKKEGKASVSSWQFPEPDVRARFGTDFAEEESDKGMTRITLDPEDLFYFFLGGRSVEMYTHPYNGKEMGETETDAYPQTMYVALPAVPAEDGSPQTEKRGETVKVRLEMKKKSAKQADAAPASSVRERRGIVVVKKRNGERTPILVLKRRSVSK